MAGQDTGRPAGFRTDIQALRGLAVLLVILQHARTGFVGAGFLGVDVFFVVSGFLVTGMVARDILAGRFSFGAFYLRRARRLLPAAYVTFAATALASLLLLDAAEWRDFTAQLAGAASFTGNLVLYHQTGYFAGAAALKPLLHVWSLAIEEQYYLLLPAMLVLAPRRWWSAGCALVLAGSLALYLAWSMTRPDAAFYLLPARAWELALGSGAALLELRGRVPRRAVAVLFLPALAAVCLLPVWPLPGWAAVNNLLVCCGTAVVLLRRHDALDDRPLPNAFAAVGDASYSLYLAHWPVFALLANAYAGNPASGTPGPVVLATATLLALALGWLLFRVVERPLRQARGGSPRRWALAGGALTAAFLVLPLLPATRALAMPRGPGSVDYLRLRDDNVGFDAVCDNYRRLEYTQRCSNATHPGIVVWGDSFAMHLVRGIAATTDAGVLQATKSACGPYLGLAQVYQVYTREFAERCLGFNASVLGYLAAAPDVRVVVLSTPVYPYFDPQRRMLHLAGGKLEEVAPDEALALHALRDTVLAVRRLGKRVVVVAPPPSDGFDYTHCVERRARNGWLLRGFAQCDIPLARYRASKREVLAFLARLQREADVPVLSFDATLCDARACRTELAGTPLYRDEGHLSNQGSVVLARAMHLGARLESIAR